MASPKPIRGPHRAVLLRPRPGERFEDASALYGIPHWGKRFFHVSEDGNLVVRPTRDPARGVALKAIVDEVGLRGITTPIIIRFPQILASAVGDLNKAFARAIEEFEYGNVYRGVFPIKVNQKRVVVEQIIEAGRPYGYGLEARTSPPKP
jgi:arginine decarboxylase